MIEWVNSYYGYGNRKDILATLPKTKKQSLGQIVEVTIPYEFKRTYNTRAFNENNEYEIRNYGKFTIGRRSLKKEVFFNYINEINPKLVRIDEEGKNYINVFKYKDTLTPESFAGQIVAFTLLINNYKNKYRIV